MKQVDQHSPADECPSLELLSSFITGRVSTDDGERLERHVETCDHCSELIANTQFESDEFEAALRDACREDWPYNEPEMQEMELRVRNALSATLDERQATSEPESPPLPLGYRISQYELLGQLGAGGMGFVYLAKQETLNRRIALKVLATKRIGDEKSIKRFLREMQAIGQLSHPNIVHSYDAGESGGVHFLAMEYVVGRDLHLVVHHTGQTRVADACEMIRQAAIGLQHVHDAGLIHRDIKPSNLLLSFDGVVKLVDLGLASLSEAADQQSMLTSNECIIGTPEYMSPEQAGGERLLDARSDLYSLGCTLYHLLAGVPPFDRAIYDSPLKLLAAQSNAAPPPLDSLRPDLPRELVELCHRLLAKDPRDRFGASRDLVTALTPWTEGADLPGLVERVPARPIKPLKTRSRHGDTSPTELPRPAKPKTAAQLTRWLGAVVALLITLLVALFFVGQAFQWFGSPDSRSNVYNPAPLVSPLDRSTPKDPTGDQSKEPSEEPIDKNELEPAPKTFESLLPEEVTPHEPYDLLNEVPILVHWPIVQGEGILHNKTRKQISISHPEIGLLKIGVAPVESYIFEVDIQQNTWTGGVGVFFGMRLVREGNEDMYHLQHVLLERNFGEDYETYPFFMQRGMSYKKVDPNGSPPQVRSKSLGFEKVKMPTNRPQTLEITVVHGRLSQIRWGGLELPSLTKWEISERVAKEDCIGGFGVFVFDCHALFSNAQIKFNTEYESPSTKN